MIELVQAPANSRVIADGNDTLIMLRANPSGDYYVRVKIFIDGSSEPFLQQSWSKNEDGLCVFNLKHLYLSYFQNAFSSEIETGFRKMEGLLKRVQVVAEEFQVGAVSPVFTLELQEFSILKNHRPQVFDDGQTVAFLDLPQDNINVSRQGGFIFPLYLLEGQELTVNVVDELGASIYTETLSNYPTQVTQYELNFPDLPVADLDTVFVRFSTSQHSIQKKLKFINESIFPPKQVYYLNNCGFYLIAYLLGRKEMENALTPKSYTQKDGTEVTYDVEDIKQLQLNSGYGYGDITALVHAIATSLDVRLQLQGYWERVKSETKKVQDFVDNQFIYSEVLQFSRLNIPNFTNESTYAILPEVSDLTVNGFKNLPLEILKAQFLALFSATQSATRLRFKSLPLNGKLSITTTTDTFNLSDMVANDPGIMPYVLDLDTLVSVTYTPSYLQFGIPLDVVEFDMGTAILWSNIASMNLNVADVPDAELPPNIEVNSILEMALDATGGGAKQVQATITDPEGDVVSVLWSVIGDAPISFNDPTLESPTIIITGGVAPVTYQVKVTATDTGNGLISEKTVNIKTSDYLVSIVSSPVSTNLFQLSVEGGQPGKKIDVVFTVQSANNEQFALIYYGTIERILYGNGSTLRLETICDENGKVPMSVNLTNLTTTSLIFLTARIDTAEAPQFIDENNREITISV